MGNCCSSPKLPERLLDLAYGDEAHCAEAMERALKGGADPNLKPGFNKDTADRNWLMHAARFGYPKLVTVLLRHNANVDAVDASGKTALIHALEKANTSGDGELLANLLTCTELMLANNANVNAADADGTTALMHAAMLTSSPAHALKFVELLLARNANVNAANALGKTALMYVVHKAGMTYIGFRVKEQLDLLSGVSCSGTEGGQNVVDSYLACTKLLLEHNANVDAADADGRTALMYCMYGRLSMSSNDMLTKQVALLLDYKANIDAATHKHMTALKMAISDPFYKAQTELVAILLRNGADPLQCGGGQSPLQYLFQYLHQYQGTDEIDTLKCTAKLLLETPQVKANSKAKMKVARAAGLADTALAVGTCLQVPAEAVKGIEIQREGPMRVIYLRFEKTLIGANKHFVSDPQNPILVHDKSEWQIDLKNLARDEWSVVPLKQDDGWRKMAHECTIIKAVKAHVCEIGRRPLEEGVP